uniref:Serine hydroxymethyltransferase n=1 Tax=Lygus hesperus TaxID=30085 RepID=A0A0A9WYV5_LYGHE
MHASSDAGAISLTPPSFFFRDENGHVSAMVQPDLEHSPSVLPTHVDGEDAFGVVNVFVPASPNEDSNNNNVKSPANNFPHSPGGAVSEDGNDFNSIFQKFVSNPETHHIS